MPDELLTRILAEVRERKAAAQAAYDESRRLEAALAALDRQEGAGTSAAPRRSRGSARRPAATRSRRRAPRGENRRRILALVEERPGVTAGEVAQSSGIARPTVASTLAKLAADGAVERVQQPGGGVGFRLATAAPEQPAPEQPAPEAPPEPAGASE
jgi:DNA-binding transcriptional ArsR family regulator